MSDIDLEFWMTNLSQELRSTPIKYLAIPGSHDSGTFAITPSSDISPDAETPIKLLSYLGCFVKGIITQWSITQNYTFRDQIYRGIRYFDLRIATKPKSDLFYFVHSLYSAEVQGELEEINDFLEQHPNEIVIIDCQHLYSFKSYDHKRFKNLLVTIFGQKLQPFTNEMDKVTLESMTELNQYQVILIYRESPTDLENYFWPSTAFPNPWANMIVSWNLIDFLIAQLKERDYTYGYVSQCVLTPSASYILRHLCSNLMSKCFLPLEEYKYNWLLNQKAGLGGVNVIISDFVDYEDDEFAKAVVSLNLRLD